MRIKVGDKWKFILGIVYVLGGFLINVSWDECKDGSQIVNVAICWKIVYSCWVVLLPIFLSADSDILS